MGGSKRAHNKRTNRSKLMSFMEDNPPHPHFSSLPPPPKFLRFRRHWIQPPLLENPAHAHGHGVVSSRVVTRPKKALAKILNAKRSFALMAGVQGRGSTRI